MSDRFATIIEEENEHARRQIQAILHGHVEEAVGHAARHAATQVARAQTLSRFDVIVEAALGRLPREDLLHDLLEQTRRLLDVDAAVLLLLEEGGLRPCSAVGFTDEAGLRESRIPKGTSFSGRVLEAGHTLWVDHPAQAIPDLHPAMAAEGFAFLAGTPLPDQGGVAGALVVGHRSRHLFPQEDAALLELVAERVAATVRHLQRFEAERDLRERAETTARFRSDLLNMLGHDLKTPLSALGLQFHMLARPTLDASARAKAGAIVERSLERLRRMLDDMLDLARLESGHFVLTRAPVDLGDVARQALEMFAPRAREAGLDLEASIQPGLVVRGDERRLGQVASNLLSNAIRYSAPGGRIRLTVADADPHPPSARATHPFREDAHAALCVTDSGRGLSAEEIATLFQPFTQVRASGGVGTGLGLYLSKHVVEEHGGTITLNSPGPGQGTTVCVLLPSDAPAASAGQPSGDHGQVPGNSWPSPMPVARQATPRGAVPDVTAPGQQRPGHEAA